MLRPNAEMLSEQPKYRHDNYGLHGLFYHNHPENLKGPTSENRFKFNYGQYSIQKYKYGSNNKNFVQT